MRKKLSVISHQSSVAHLALLITGYWLLITVCAGASVTLAWDRNTEPEVIGYRIYLTDDLVFWPFEITVPRNAGNTNYYTVSNLPPSSTWWFVATAYTTNLESEYSNMLQYTAPAETNIFSVTLKLERSLSITGAWNTWTQWEAATLGSNQFIRAKLFPKLQ